VARKNSLERPEPRKKPREEPGYEGWPVLFWLCRVEIITEHGQNVQTFIDYQQDQIIIITVVVEGATGQHLRRNVSWLFIAEHSEFETAGAEERVENSRSGTGRTSDEQVRVP
jgi:hypothetical protein